jgi:hypothetical protein
VNPIIPILKQNQVKNKQLYDKNAMIRKFKSGEKVIVLLLIRCHPLHATYCWPFVIESRLNDLNYIVNTPKTRKKRKLILATLIPISLICDFFAYC